MKVYHVTNGEAARAILAGGFQDQTGKHLTANEYTGVFVANHPLYLSGPFDPFSDPCLEIAIDEKLLAAYEWVEEFKRFREWLVPAKVLNEHGVVHVVPVEQVQELEWA